VKYKELQFFIAYGCETRFIILREEHRLRIFENRVQGEIFGLRRGKYEKAGENCIVRICMTCTPVNTSRVMK
jgi:hypothetical protein